MSVIEMVSFELNSVVSDADFLQASQAIDSWVKPQAGFEYRALVKHSDGIWQDLVFWQDMACAEQAGAKFMQANELAGALALITKETVMVKHAPVLAQLPGA